MFIIPYSTDVHDGRIRLAALEIIGLCLLVHIFVSIDARRVERKVADAMQLWQQEQMEKLYDTTKTAVDHIAQIEKLIDDYTNKTISGPPQDLLARIMEVRKTSLMYRLGLIFDDFRLHALLTSMFTHGGWFHLIGNMIMFYVCGLAMEQYWGYWRFLIIYLVCGVAADAAFAGTVAASHAQMNGIPLVGASGAIAGIMGAFLMTHSRVRVKLFYMFGFWFRGVFALPAYVYFGFWFLQQVASALLDANHTSGVAYTAHIGGFIVGGVLGKLVKSADEAAIVDPRLARIQQRKTAEAEARAFPKGFYHTPTQGIHEPITEEDGKPEAPSMAAAERAGWESLERGDAARARVQLSLAMNTSLQNFDQYRPGFAALFTNLIKHRDRLQFSQNEYYQWGKLLESLKEYKFAIICFDFAAFKEGNAHIQKNSLLEASRLRIKTSYQLGKVQRDMEFLLSIDPEGIAGNQAREMLGELRGMLPLSMRR
jgi:membrane associated rhomboid family serine protease